ncbi:MAG: site-specific integrase [Acidobacteriota bacterium]
MSTKRRLSNGQTVIARQNGGLRKRCGCARTAWTRCSHPWHGNVSHDGREYRVSLAKWAKKPAGYVMLQGEAKAEFRKWLTSIEGGRETAVAKAAALTLNTVAAIYLKEYVHQPDRRKAAAAEMARLVDVVCGATVARPEGGTVTMGDLAIADVTKPVIEAFRQMRRQAHEDGMAAREQIADLQATQQNVPAELVARAKGAALNSSKAGRVATNRILSRLRHLFAWAIAEKGFLEASPFSKGGVSVIRLDHKAEGRRSRRLQGDEEVRLLAAAGAHLRACIEAALETGMRRGEILGLQWQHVHDSTGVIDVSAAVAKTGESRQVIITSRLAAILDMQRSAQRAARELDAAAALPGTAHPFGNELGEPVKGFKTAWKLTCQRATITGLHFHDLRRESGSRLLETPGVSVTDVRDFLGHRDVSQTNTYLSSTTLSLRSALQRRDIARTSLAQPPIADDDANEAPSVTH